MGRIRYSCTESSLIKLKAIIASYQKKRWTQLKNETGVHPIDDFTSCQKIGTNVQEVSKESKMLWRAVISVCEKFDKNLAEGIFIWNFIGELCGLIDNRYGYFDQSATSFCNILLDNRFSRSSVNDYFHHYLSFSKVQRQEILNAHCVSFALEDGNNSPLFVLHDALPFAQGCLKGQQFTFSKSKCINTHDNSKAQYLGNINIESKSAKCIMKPSYGGGHIEPEAMNTNHGEVTDDSGAYGGGFKASDAKLGNIINEPSPPITFTRRVTAPITLVDATVANDEGQAHIGDNDENCRNFKLVIVGDRGTGKTTFASRPLNGLPGIVVDDQVRIYTMEFNTTSGPIRFHCWDVPGLPNCDSYLIHADCAILMFDVTNSDSFFNIRRRWRPAISRVCDNIPIVICGNKVDRLNDRVVTPWAVARSLRQPRVQYYELCARSNYNFERPFLYLSRQLVNSELYFVHVPTLAIPDVHVDLEAQERNEVEFATAIARM